MAQNKLSASPFEAIATEEVKPVQVPEASRFVPIEDEEAAPAPRAKAPTRADVIRKAREYDVDPALVLSIWSQESSSNWNSRDSAKGARGGMQVMPDTFRAMMGNADQRDPWNNLEAGVKYIAYGQKTLGTKDPELLAAGYHSGYDRKSLKSGIIPNVSDGAKNTRDYAREVAARAGGGDVTGDARVMRASFNGDATDGQRNGNGNPTSVERALNVRSDSGDAARFLPMSDDEVKQYQATGVPDMSRFVPMSDEEAKAFQLEAAPARERTWGEAAKDTGVQLAEGVNNIIGAVPNLIAPESKVAGFFNENADYWRDQQSDPLKAKIADADQKITAAGEDGVISQIGEAASIYFTDPALAARFITTNLPSMIPGIGAAKVAQAAALAKGASAARAAQVATTAAGATGAVLNAGGARGEAYEDIKNTLMSKGMGQAEAEEQAIKDSRLVAAVGAAAGFVSGKTGLEGAIAGKAAAGSAVRRGVGAATAELAGEQIEEVAPKLATNMQASQYDDRSIGKDVGRTVVETAIGSGPGAALAGTMVGRAPQQATPEAQPQDVPAQPAQRVEPSMGEQAGAGAPDVAAPALDNVLQNQQVAEGGAPAQVPQQAAPAAPPSGPLTAAVEAVADTEAVAEQRVTVTVPEVGEVSGTMQHYEAGENGNFVAEVLTDDGEVLQFTHEDGVTIQPVEAPAAPSGPLSTAVEEAAEQHAVDPAPAPVQAPAKPAEPDYASMDLPALRERLKYIAGQAKASGGWNKMFLDARKQVEEAIKQKTAEAQEASRPSEEPLSAGPFDKRAQANSMMLRFAEQTGQPHEVVEADGKFTIKPLQEQSDDQRSDSTGGAVRDVGVGSTEAAAPVGTGDTAGSQVDQELGGSGQALSTGTGASAGTDVPSADVPADAQPALSAVNLVRMSNAKDFDWNKAKPNGTYASIAEDPASFTSPFADDYKDGKRHDLQYVPKKPLKVGPLEVKHARFGRLGSGDASAGVKALHASIPQDEFDRALAMSKEEVQAEIGKRFPNVDASKAHDAYEALEIWGAQEAKARGHDIILARDEAMPQFSEAVLLDGTGQPKAEKPQRKGQARLDADRAKIKRQEDAVAKAAENIAKRKAAKTAEATTTGASTATTGVEGDTTGAKKEPWQMSRKEWDAAREAVRPNVAQSRFTNASASEAVGNHERLQNLLYGVTDSARQRLRDAQDGKVKLSRDEVDDLMDRINMPVHHADVVAKAVAEGKPVPAEVLAEYPELAATEQPQPVAVEQAPAPTAEAKPKQEPRRRAKKAEPAKQEPRRATKARTGRETSVRINDRKVPAKWEVVEADELEATIAKSDNQYRDRTRAASVAQIGQIANAPAFDLLADSPVMDFGAPTLARDGRTIIGGNGRFAGLVRAYQQGTASDYRAELESNAKRFGVSTKGMRQPVLVRRFDEDVDIKEAAIASNEGGGLKMSALEQAKVDAERMGDMADFVVGDNGDIASPANGRFIRGFMSKMPQNQQASFVDADGKLSQEGIVRIRNAVLFRAYGDSPTLARMVESADPGLRNIVTAMLRVAPKIADAKARIADGDLHDLDISEEIVTAVEQLNKLRAEGTTVDDFINQLGLFGDTVADEVATILRYMDANTRSAKALADFLGGYYDAVLAAGSPKQDNMFGADAVPSKREIIDAKAKRQVAEEQQSDIFADRQAGREAEGKSEGARGTAEDGKRQEVGAKYSVAEEAAGAVQQLMADKEGSATVTREGIGEIAIEYGDKDAGLAHIAARRGAAFMDRLPSLLATGEVYTKANQPDRIFIGNERDEAVIRTDRDGAKENWLLSAYEKHPEGKQSRATETKPDESYERLSDKEIVEALTIGTYGPVIEKLVEHGKIVLHRSAKTLPKEVKVRKGVQAVTMPDGTIHLVTGNLRRNNARAVLLHELFHSDVKPLIGAEKWGDMMGRLGSLYRQSEQSSGKAKEFFDRARERVEKAKAKGAVPIRMEVEEFAAYAIEEYERAPDSLPAAIRKWVEDFIGMVKAYVQGRYGKQLGQITPAQLAGLSKLAIAQAAHERRGEMFGPIGELFSVDGQPRATDTFADQMREKYPGLRLDLSETRKGDILLSRVVVPMDGREQGTGTKFMTDLIRFADEQGRRITLTPSSDFGGNKARLVKFYKRFGFVENSGRNKDFATMEAMYRDPVDGPAYSVAEDQTDADPAAQQIDRRPLSLAIEGGLARLKKDGILPMVPMNYLVDYARENMTAVKEYMRVKRAMDTYRGDKHGEYDQHAQRWMKFNGTNKKHAQALADLMHESTIAQVDPSQPYSPDLSEAEKVILKRQPKSEAAARIREKIEAEPARKEAYDALAERFSQLPEEGKALYRDTRDLYAKQAKELDKIIEENVERTMKMAIDKAKEKYEANVEEAKAELKGEDLKKELARLQADYAKESGLAKYKNRARITALRQVFEANRLAGPYFPLARFGEYFVAVRDENGDMISFNKFEGLAEARKFEQEAKKANPKHQIKSGVMSNRDAVRGAVDPKFLADIEGILEQSGVPNDVQDEVWQRYLATMPDLSMRKKFIHRKGTAGYSRDALRAFASNMFHGSHQMARLKFAPQLTEALDQMRKQGEESDKPVDAGLLVNEFERRHEWVMNPQGNALAQGLSSAAFIWNLSLTPAAAIVNTSQTFMMGVPVLGSRLGGQGRALVELAKASKELMTSKRWSVENNLRLNPKEKEALTEFYRLGLIDRTQSHDLAGVGETGVEYNPAVAKGMKIVSFLYHHAERINREVTALAAYRMARRLGQDHEQAIETSAEATWATHFDYSSSNRPRYLQGNWQKALLIHRQHSINMSYRLFRDLHDATKGETPEVRKQARAQFVGVLAMHGLMAGIKGIPFYGIAMIAAGLLGGLGDEDPPLPPEERLEKALRESGVPKWLAETLMYGAPSVGSGLSVTTRIGFPDLWFRSPDEARKHRFPSERRHEGPKICPEAWERTFRSPGKTGLPAE